MSIVTPSGDSLPYPLHTDRIAARARGTLVLTVAASLMAFFAWAAFTSLDKVTHGAGRVIPQLQNQVIQHFEGGIVTEILVREGETVARGTPMLRVENSFARSELLQAQIEIKAKGIRAARLAAESQGSDRVELPAALAAELPGIAAQEMGLFETRRRTLMVQLRILDDQVRQKDLELAELKARLGLTRNERELLVQRLVNLRKLNSIGAVSSNDLLDNERQLQQMEARISDLTHDIPRTDAALSELAGRRSEQVLKFRGDADRDRVDTQVQIAKLVESVQAMQERSVRTEVIAPMAGVVNKLFVNTIGGVVKSGDPLIQLVPAGSSVAVEARLSPADRAQVWPGLPAVVKVSAYDFSVYGGLPGKVIDISPDALPDEKGQPYFRVRLEADGTAFGAERPVVPGMLADVNIISGKQTVLDALVRPVRRVQENALR
jgi:HlyD family type I secretion membrane fusion protein